MVQTMLGLIVRRVLLMLLTGVAVSALLFFTVTQLLGSPAAMMLGQDASPQAVAALNAQYGFDRPAVLQYLHWLGNAFNGDFGRSYTTKQSVAEAIAARVPVTIELSLWSIALAVIAAVVCNTAPVARRLLQPVVTTVNLVGITVPNFMLGVSLIFMLSVQLNLLPSTGWAPWSDGVGVHLWHMIMPVLTLSAYYFGSFSIVYRAEYRSVLDREFIRVAHAKGLSEWRVAFRHAAPNAILPVITFVGISMGQLTGGAVVTETIFSMPGMGRLFVSSIEARDFPVMLAVSMLIVVGVVFMNLLADIGYEVANPLIRHRS
ncbi:MAG: ABC transporter permease [Alphaproteobacteria bacterium]|nr:ABC transporter permease [Alphaproteobacteria bacterium]MBV9152026.1 ABC transporter permease [Alphaproteobacteria bacterium]